ncbi:uncharacterized protein EV422DRAFT_282626 [Fimicolochytrium jonesii]|uniref:uncharacterized protein n=1 Tax=Fimicolochytrium jonesii TaxID=1396493 RepID=UPI0022FE7F00|nr:uncharacterized protein EV422DRAFT_282626 [Fimicolochytrium jonesii]KAI8816654.1 hypothetical protein EV422DRAFT_282626 [Fimicolochytrium jonesii]
MKLSVVSAGIAALLAFQGAEAKRAFRIPNTESCIDAGPRYTLQMWADCNGTNNQFYDFINQDWTGAAQLRSVQQGLCWDASQATHMTRINLSPCNDEVSKWKMDGAKVRLYKKGRDTGMCAWTPSETTHSVNLVECAGAMEWQG